MIKFKPPWQIVCDVLDRKIKAFQRNPAKTIATVVLPHYPRTAWYRYHFARKNRRFRTLRIYPAGSLLYHKAVRTKNAFAFELASNTTVPVMVVRLQAWADMGPLLEPACTRTEEGLTLLQG